MELVALETTNELAKALDDGNSVAAQIQAESSSCQNSSDPTNDDSCPSAPSAVAADNGQQGDVTTYEELENGPSTERLKDRSGRDDSEDPAKESVNDDLTSLPLHSVSSFQDRRINGILIGYTLVVSLIAVGATIFAVIQLNQVAALREELTTVDSREATVTLDLAALRFEKDHFMREFSRCEIESAILRHNSKNRSGTADAQNATVRANLTLLHHQLISSEIDNARARGSLADCELHKHKLVTNLTACERDTAMLRHDLTVAENDLDSCRGGPPTYVSCAAAPRRNQVYLIAPFEETSFQAYCEQISGAGYMVIQRRTDGQTSFNTSYASYILGFGLAEAEYWLGLENIHRLTTTWNYQLRVDLMDWDDNTKYATYSTFRVGDRASGYRLTIDGYAGTAGDAMGYHNGMRFSTYDNDVDDWSSGNCAEKHRGGWWYKSCYRNNLNGKYYVPPTARRTPDEKGVAWTDWHGNFYSLKRVTMSITRL